MFKKIFSYFILVCARIYQFIFYPFFSAYYKFFFKDKFKIGKAKLGDYRDSSSFVFVLLDLKEVDYFFKKQNFIANIYDRYFLKHSRLDGKNLHSALEEISKNPAVKEIIPDYILFKDKLLIKSLENEDFTRLDYFFENYKSNIDKINKIKKTLERIVEELNKLSYIHGDIKAKNVYINKKDEKIKIIDWDGLRKISEPEKDLDRRKLKQVFENLNLLETADKKQRA